MGEFTLFGCPLYECTTTITGCTNPLRKMNAVSTYLHCEVMSSLRMFAARTLCGGRYFDFYRNTTCLSCRTPSTLSTTVRDVLQEHMRNGDRYIDAPTRFRWYPTAYRMALLKWTQTYYLMEVTSVKTKAWVEWQSRDKETMNPEEGGRGCTFSYAITVPPVGVETYKKVCTAVECRVQL